MKTLLRAALVSCPVPPGALLPLSDYRWRARYADNHGHEHPGVWGASLTRDMQSLVTEGRRRDPNWMFAMEGCGDGLYSACRMIAFLAQNDKTLSQWRWECPPTYVTPELQIEMPLQSQARIMEKIRREWSSFSQQVADGIRIETPGGWFLVRPSAADSVLNFRFESLDWPALDHLVQRVCDTIEDWGKELWRQYAAAIGTGSARE